MATTCSPGGQPPVGWLMCRPASCSTSTRSEAPCALFAPAFGVVGHARQLSSVAAILAQGLDLRSQIGFLFLEIGYIS